MMFDIRSLRIAGVVAMTLITNACGKKADAGGAGDVAEVSAAGVPDVAGARSGDENLRELSRYELTMPKVRQWATAQESYQKLERDHPELKQKHENAENDDDESMDKSAAEVTAAIEREPLARKVIEDAGLRVREYVLISLTLVQASVGQMLIQQGQKPDSVARELKIHPANLRFVKEHDAELAKLKHLYMP